MSAAKRANSRKGRLKRASREQVWDFVRCERVARVSIYSGNERNRSLCFGGHIKNKPRRKLERFLNACARNLLWGSLSVQEKLRSLDLRYGDSVKERSKLNGRSC